MKHLKKAASLLLAFVMVCSMTTTVFAKNVTVGTGEGTITISNAAKGETYKIYKVFDATVTGEEDGSIAYTGEVPTELQEYFVKDSAGNITTTEAAYQSDTKDMSEGLRSALTAWTEKTTTTKEAKADGTVLQFTQVAYGYYVVTTTQGEQSITVDSTNPSATIVDKNSTIPHGLTKEVSIDNEKIEDVNIGDIVTYNVSFKTANFHGAGDAAKEIVSYTIHDTLPEFLEDVKITEALIDEDGDKETTKDQKVLRDIFQFDPDTNSIVLDWYDEDKNQFLYTNGATVFLTYIATVTDQAVIDGAGNKNTVTVTWNTYNPENSQGDSIPEEDKLEASSVFYTYAIAFKKVDQKGNPLAGAEFELPFYVQEGKDGVYVYAGTIEGEGLTNQVTTSCVNANGKPENPKDGLIVIKGLSIPKSKENEGGTGYTIKEIKAPDGYNKLPGDSTFTVKPEKTGAETTEKTIYLDENGEVVEEATEHTNAVKVELPIAATVQLVVNKMGIELPQTGDLGTMLFYAIGGMVAISGTLLLIWKTRKMHK